MLAAWSGRRCSTQAAAPSSNWRGAELFRGRHRVEPPADPWEVVLGLLFPEGLDPDQNHRVRYAIGDAPPSIAAARVALGALDQQTTESPVTIRWGVADLVHVAVGDVQMALDRADASVSVQIIDGGYEPHVAAVLDRLLGPGDVFVDVGANVGYHTFRAATRVGADGRVIAVEANPENARLIAHTIESNGLTNIELVPMALADGRGYANFGTHVGSNGGFLPDKANVTGSGRGTIVPTIALDDLGLDRVEVVKIDVEGGEGIVIDGARATILRHRPAFVMEFSQEMTTRVSGRTPHEHLERFIDWGYSIAIIDRATHEPQPVGSVGQLLDRWGDFLRIEDLLLVPVDGN
jgi:FkbM family methyltransferase